MDLKVSGQPADNYIARKNRKEPSVRYLYQVHRHGEQHSGWTADHDYVLTSARAAALRAHRDGRPNATVSIHVIVDPDSVAVPCPDCGDAEVAPGQCKTCDPGLVYPPRRCGGAGTDGHGCDGYMAHVPYDEDDVQCRTCSRLEEAATEAS